MVWMLWRSDGSLMRFMDEELSRIKVQCHKVFLVIAPVERDCQINHNSAIRSLDEPIPFQLAAALSQSQTVWEYCQSTTAKTCHVACSQSMIQSEYCFMAIFQISMVAAPALSVGGLSSELARTSKTNALGFMAIQNSPPP